MLRITFRLHQICVPVVRNALEADDKGLCLLCCIRAYVELDLLASFDVHTDETIKYGKVIAEKFVKLANARRISRSRNFTIANVLVIRTMKRGAGTSPKCI